MLFATRIKELEGQLSAAIGERDSATASVTSLTAERDQLADANRQCEERHTTDQLTITTLTGERDAAVQRADAAETSITDQVNQRLSAAGVDPIKRDPKAAVDSPTGDKAAGTARERLAASFNSQFQK